MINRFKSVVTLLLRYRAKNCVPVLHPQLTPLFAAFDNISESEACVFSAVVVVGAFAFYLSYQVIV